MRDLPLHRKAERAKLKPRGEPYWAPPLKANCSLGLRITPKSMIWTARYKEDGGRTYKKLGRLTDAFDFKQARDAAEKWFKDLERGVDDGSATVETACRAYVEDRRTEVSEACAHDAEKRFERTVYDTPFGKIPLGKIRAVQIKAWRNGLVDPVDDDQRPVSKATANRTMTSLKAALNLAVRDRRVSADMENEWSSVKPYDVANNRRDLYLDLDQRRALLKAADGAVRDLIEAAMYTGARAGELTSALKKQFDQRTGSLTLRGGTEGGKSGRGKTGERKVPLSPAAITLFERLAKSKLPTARLLVRDDGKRWAHSDWDELVRDAATKAELPVGVCLYTMRHSFITTALQGGMAVSDVSYMVGTSAVMIQKHYHHLVDAHVRERLANAVMA